MRIRYPIIPVLGMAVLGMAACPGSVHAQAYQFKTFDYPSAANTYAHGINNAGQIVGRYDSSGNAVSSGFSVNAGSLPSNGFSTYTTGDTFTEFDAVSDAGQVVGGLRQEQRQHQPRLSAERLQPRRLQPRRRVHHPRRHQH